MKSFRKPFVVLVVALLLAPSAFLAAPQPAVAEGLPVFDAFNFIKNTLTSAYEAISSSSILGINVKEYVLDPIAWALSNKLLQSITGSTINFVNGKSNGTGQPQFVQNLLGTLQKSGDNQALAFFAQFTSGSKLRSAFFRTNAMPK